MSYLAKNQQLIIDAFLRHIELSFVSVLIGFIIAFPLGIWLSRHQKLAKYFMGAAGLIQTIPGLVLLGFALLFFGMGKGPAIGVLVLYSILPVLRNTYTGITSVGEIYRDAAKGVGMTTLQVLFKVELPLALPTIIAGVRLSIVYIISWATIAGLNGAGGLGDLIWTGLASYDKNLILLGSIPASILAIGIGLVIDAFQRKVTPRGLREEKRV